MDERFCRMWEFYLAGAEIGFRYQNLMVFQLQLTKDQKALPLTRDYIYTSRARFPRAGRAASAAAGAPRQALNGHVRSLLAKLVPPVVHSPTP